MKTLPIEGTLTEVDFYEDDTIERVRELIAIRLGSHPDRLFLQLRVTLPEGYYATPREWSDLFLRLSRDGQTVRDEELRLYLNEVRPGVGDFPVHLYTREEWEAVDPKAPIRRDGGEEWRILGSKVQPILPLPPKDVDLPASLMPILSMQNLFETVHTLPSSELRATVVPDAPSDAVRRVYFPRVDPKRTPVNLDATKGEILASQAKIGELLGLTHVKRHTSVVFNKAKWIIPLNATRIPNPRVLFEQMFYGLTLSKETPFVGYYMSGETKLRSKVYVEDPKSKVPSVDLSLVKAWYTVSMPNRRRPTLLLYRGSSRSVFQRIAITSTDITIDIRKDRGSTKGLEALKKEADEWLRSLDAVLPFLDERDLAPDRWSLLDMSLLATYAKEETQFEMMRFDCLRSLFAEENGTFRLLRTDQGKVSRRQLDACRALTQEDVAPTADSLASALGTSLDEARALLAPILSGDVDCERAIQEYPVIRFDRKEAEINFVTNPERVLTYVDILRYVLTTNSAEVNAVCPRRQEAVPAMSVLPQSAAEEDEEDDEGFDISALTVTGANAAAPPPPPAPVKKPRTVQVAEEKKNTQNYFNARLQEFNKELFATPYSKECEKNNQVVVLTPEETERIRTEKGEHYTYEDAPEEERMDIPGGMAICPPYWCMTDLVPLREDDLTTDAEGVKHCPICDGKVRPNDKVSPREYPVIKRQTSKGQMNKYPRGMRNRPDVPCCFPTPEKEKAGESHRVDKNYILGETVYNLDPERAGRLSADLAARMGLTTSYDTTIVNKRLNYDTEDVFRIGLGPQPRDTLPEILGTSKRVPDPKEREDIVRQCSFYATAGKDPLAEIQRRWEEKTMDPLDQIEYMSFFLDISVILVDALQSKVDCGFQADRMRERVKTIVVFLYGTEAPPELLGVVRRKKKSARTAEVSYQVNLADGPLAKESERLFALRQMACQGTLPTVSKARAALVKELTIPLVPGQGEGAEGIADANGQLQSFFVKKTVILPFVPVSVKLAETLVQYIPQGPLRRLHEIPEGDLPDYATQVATMNKLSEADLFHHEPSKDHRNAMGQIVEVETVSGFRIPVQPSEPSPGPNTEVLQTLRTATPPGEEALLTGSPDPEGRSLKDAIDYQSELYEFLLFSLANDIAVDESGEARTDYGALRTAIVNRNAKALREELVAWYKARVDETIKTSAYEFLSKVRTPCGQLTKDACKSSLLCGWVDKGDVCKIQVRTTQVDTNLLLERIHRTLVENEKQRALVLDNRMSRFFSTMLFQELPHELFTVV